MWTHEERPWRIIAGPWDDEPDKAQWVDDATGLDCLIHRNGIGALCGYVGVPNGHPLYGVNYEDTPEQVYTGGHGSLTYSAPCADSDDESYGVCHVPEPGRPDDVWWLGFDAAHMGDLVPVSAASPVTSWPETYRDFGYVAGECAALAQAIAETVVTP